MTNKKCRYKPPPVGCGGAQVPCRLGCCGESNEQRLFCKRPKWKPCRPAEKASAIRSSHGQSGRRRSSDRWQLGDRGPQARKFSGLAVDTLVELTKDNHADLTRFAAAAALLDRGYGRPAQSLDLHLSADAITKRLSDMTDELAALEQRMIAIRRPNQWSGSRHLRGGRWDEILDAEYTKSSSIKSRRHSAPSPRWRFQQLSSPKWPARMRSSSPKRTHIIGRAKLNSQTLVVSLLELGLRVQGFSADDVAVDTHTYEPVVCTACKQTHLVNPATGIVLGADIGQAATKR